MLFDKIAEKENIFIKYYDNYKNQNAGKMLNLLTLESDRELEEKKLAVRKKDLIPYEQIAGIEKELGIVDKHAQFKKLLIIFDRFCRNNNIKYSLADGTLLGAYRHHHFIPWDDDADVMMTRSEYEKYCRALKRTDELREFTLLFCHRVSTETFYSHGIIIDLFVLDDIPVSKAEWECRKFLSRILRVSCFNGMSMQNIKKRKGFFNLVLYIFFPIVFLFGRLERLILWKKIFEFNEKLAKVKSASNFYTKYTSNWRELNRIFKKEWFDNYCDIEMEGHTFMCIAGVEDYITNMFGEWKNIPPMENIKLEHDHIPKLLADEFVNSWNTTY